MVNLQMIKLKDLRCFSNLNVVHGHLNHNWSRQSWRPEVIPPRVTQWISLWHHMVNQVPEEHQVWGSHGSLGAAYAMSRGRAWAAWAALGLAMLEAQPPFSSFNQHSPPTSKLQHSPSCWAPDSNTARMKSSTCFWMTMLQPASCMPRLASNTPAHQSKLKAAGGWVDLFPAKNHPASCEWSQQNGEKCQCKNTQQISQLLNNILYESYNINKHVQPISTLTTQQYPR